MKSNRTGSTLTSANESRRLPTPGEPACHLRKPAVCSLPSRVRLGLVRKTTAVSKWALAGKSMSEAGSIRSMFSKVTKRSIAKRSRRARENNSAAKSSQLSTRNRTSVTIAASPTSSRELVGSGIAVEAAKGAEPVNCCCHLRKSEPSTTPSPLASPSA